MATLKDIARDAGVSIATVSCCLSGTKPVKAETQIGRASCRERV